MKKLLFLFFIGTSIAFSQTSKTIRVGTLIDRSSAEAIKVLEDIKVEIKAVMGPDVTVLFAKPLESSFNLVKAEENYNSLLADDTDIILTFGAINITVLDKYKNNALPKPILGYGSVNQDFIDIPIGQNTSEIPNLNYLVNPFSFSSDLEKLKELFDYQHIGVVIEDFLKKEDRIENFFNSYFSNKDETYSLISAKELLSNTSLLDSVDAVYFSGGYNMPNINRQVLIDSINAKKLPSFSANGISDVMMGVLATQQDDVNNENFYRRLALNFESIFNGVNASELPIYIDQKNSLSINYNTASKIDFPLRYSMLGQVDLIGSDKVEKNEYSLSILDVMKGAVASNLDLQSEMKNNELFEQEVQSSKNNYLPDLSVGAGATYVDPKLAKASFGQNPEFSATGNVALQQLIYSPNASANKTVQKELSKAQKEVYNAEELNLILDASVAYFNSLVFKTNAHIQNQNLQVTKLNLELAKQNFEEGASGKSDVLRFKSQLAQNTQSLIEAGNDLKQSYNEINALLNKPIGTKIDIENAIISEGVFKNYNYDRISELIDNPKTQALFIEFLTEEAKRNAPELKGLTYNLEAIKRNYRLNSGGKFLPTVALQGQYNYFFNRSGEGSVPLLGDGIPDGSYMVGVNVSLPIFQQNLRNVDKKTTEIQQEQIAIERNNINLFISQSVNNVVSDIATQIANVHITKIAEETAKESLELTQTAYKNGAVPVIQLIDAQTNYLQSQLATANASYGYLLTSIQLERIIGYYFLLNSEEENQAFIDRAVSHILNKK